jgi:hypothetical protein
VGFFIGLKDNPPVFPLRKRENWNLIHKKINLAPASAGANKFNTLNGSPSGGARQLAVGERILWS